MVTVIKLGYYSFVMDTETAQALASATARGDVRECDLKYMEGAYRAVVKNPVNLEIQTLEEVSSRDAEVADLKERLKKLEG